MPRAQSLPLFALMLAAACGTDASSTGDGGLTPIDAADSFADGSGDPGDVGADPVADAGDDAAADTSADAVEDTGAADAAPDGVASDIDMSDFGADTASDGGTGDASSDGGGEDASTDTGAADTTSDTGGDWLGGDPGAEGPYGSNRFEDTVPTDVQDVRTIFYLPADGSDAPYPVVVFNHGFSLAAENYETYGSRLASHGFVVLLPSIDDGLLSARTHTELRDIQVGIDAWIADAVDAPGSRLFGLADSSLLGVGGHSRGGKQAMFGAVSDDRIVAYFGVDPVDSGPPFGDNPTDFPSVAPELMGSLDIPTGYVGAGRGAETAFPGAPQCAPAEDNYRTYFAASPSPSFSWTIPDAGHNDFVDDCNITCRLACPRSDDPGAVAEFARTTMVAFFKVYLAGDAGYRPWLDGDRVADGIELSTR